MSKPTQGPWWVEEDKSIKTAWSNGLPEGSFRVFAKDGTFAFGSIVAATPNEADAELIASSPDMKQLIKDFIKDPRVCRSVAEDCVAYKGLCKCLYCRATELV